MYDTTDIQLVASTQYADWPCSTPEEYVAIVKDLRRRERQGDTVELVAEQSVAIFCLEMAERGVAA